MASSFCCFNLQLNVNQTSRSPVWSQTGGEVVVRDDEETQRWWSLPPFKPVASLPPPPWSYLCHSSLVLHPPTAHPHATLFKTSRRDPSLLPRASSPLPVVTSGHCSKHLPRPDRPHHLALSHPSRRRRRPKCPSPTSCSSSLHHHDRRVHRDFPGRPEDRPLPRRLRIQVGMMTSGGGRSRGA